MNTINYLTILGLGNILLQDEGFGVHFIRWFAERYKLPDGIQLIDGGTLGYGLLDTVSDCSHLIVIDVIKVDDAPGSLYRFSQAEMEACHPGPTSAHEVEFFDVLCKAELLDMCPETVFLCIVPQTYTDMKIGMTAVMTEKFADMEQLLLAELAKLEVFPEKVA